ncbi:MAG: SBBP repeat-containing protein, partial [Chloroflexi bacterium]|nr:SBBP repeat-containing protein [Chloroflexota bacterium]
MKSRPVSRLVIPVLVVLNMLVPALPRAMEARAAPAATPAPVASPSPTPKPTVVASPSPTATPGRLPPPPPAPALAPPATTRTSPLQAANPKAVARPKSAPPDISWVRQFGTTGVDYAYGVAVDGAGNVYVAGYTDGNLSGQNAGGADAFVRKYDASGSEQWTRQFGTSSADVATAVAVDGAGNFYVSGYTQGDLSGQNAGGLDAFVRKYDSSGTEQWTRQFGTSGNDEASFGLAVDGAGNVYVAGATNGNLSGANAGLFDAFVRKYDGSGAQQWTSQFGTTGEDRAYRVAVDGAGNVYAAGYTNGNLSGQNAGGYDAFVRKYDSSGAEQWTRQFGTSDTDFIVGVGLGGAGNVYVAGKTGGNLSGQNAGGLDAFVRKYDDSGAEQWTRQFGTSSPDEANGIALDGAGNVYVAGHTGGGLSGQNAGGLDAFIRKYDDSGAEQWTRQFGTDTNDLVMSVAVDSSNIYAVGWTFGTFSGETATGSSDAYVSTLGAPLPPVAGFSKSLNPSNGAVPNTVTFTDTSTGSPTSWSWNFGDGTGSSSQNPTKIFSNPGSYTVTLTVTNAAGSSSTSQTITTYTAPAAGFTKSVNPASGVVPVTVTFTDTSTGNPTSWSWNFGDGAGSSSQNPTKIYSNAGNYTVTLTVANPAGSNSTSQTISAYAAPAASFTRTLSPAGGGAPNTVTFADTSTGNIVSWYWNFGDGTNGSSQNPTKTYTMAGSYTVTLTVTNPAGSNSSSSQFNIRSVPGFTRSLDPSSGAVPNTVTFTDTSTGFPTAWLWDFGDGSGSSTQYPSKTFNNAGNYTIPLTVTDPV